MNNIYIVQCSKKKHNINEIIAGELYNGDIFNKSVENILLKGASKKDIYIISSKYGIINYYDTIKNYDVYISNLNKEELNQLNELMNNQIQKLNLNNKNIICYLSQNYLKKINFLKNFKYINILPPKRLGYILSYLKQLNKRN